MSQGRGFVCTLKGCIAVNRQWLSLNDDIFLKIPLDFIVVKYLGFAHLNPLESAVDLAKSKYLAASLKVSRYSLEEIVIAGLIPLFRKSQFFLTSRQMVGIFDTQKGCGFQITLKSNPINSVANPV